MKYAVTWLLANTLLALSFDPSNSAAINRTSFNIATNLLNYYKTGPSYEGALLGNGNNDASDRQWYESGILWLTISEYVKLNAGSTSFDPTFAATMTSAWQAASYDSASNFLGPPNLANELSKLFGKWNDDILWWALGVVSAVEIYGLDARFFLG